MGHARNVHTAYLDSKFYSISNFLANAFHLLSTNAFVFASITISSGQGA